MGDKKFGFGLLLIVFVFVSCNDQSLSTEELAQQVQRSINIELDGNYAGGMEISKNLSLIKKSNSEYIGTIEVQQYPHWRGGELEINVICDGKAFRWNASPTSSSSGMSSSYSGSGQVIIGTAHALNGTWVLIDDGNQIENVFNNGNCESTFNDEPFQKGTYFANNAEMKVTWTHTNVSSNNSEPEWHSTEGFISDTGLPFPHYVDYAYSVKGNVLTLTYTYDGKTVTEIWTKK